MQFSRGTRRNLCYDDCLRRGCCCQQKEEKEKEKAKDKFGGDHLAVGSDFYGCAPINNLDDYESLTGELYCNTAARYGEKTARKILYENAHSFFKVHDENVY